MVKRDEFSCPISKELMRDPVIVATGQRYCKLCQFFPHVMRIDVFYRPWDSDQNNMIEQAMKMGSVLLEADKMGQSPSLLIRWMKWLRAETGMLRLLGAFGHQLFNVIPQRNWY
ncbi:hypothetical protein RHSIM_Rhsim03G0131700 [Rhododendron simsii]|uniref:U-box domain-containing protein n=1 Tax=Rhododendron simsii TaxID=118357 RepID=A0A834LUT9_RHOSS|nr:hypothetical protein RHSIM_Rhsim03G0131700 [Rhododendron simsii]